MKTYTRRFHDRGSQPIWAGLERYKEGETAADAFLKSGLLDIRLESVESDKFVTDWLAIVDSCGRSSKFVRAGTQMVNYEAVCKTWDAHFEGPSATGFLPCGTSMTIASRTHVVASGNGLFDVYATLTYPALMAKNVTLSYLAVARDGQITVSPEGLHPNERISLLRTGDFERKLADNIETFSASAGEIAGKLEETLEKLGSMRISPKTFRRLLKSIYPDSPEIDARFGKKIGGDLDTQAFNRERHLTRSYQNRKAVYSLVYGHDSRYVKPGRALSLLLSIGEFEDNRRGGAVESAYSALISERSVVTRAAFWSLCRAAKLL